METVLFAYQITPGEDELLHFTETQEECQRAALEQRMQVKSHEDNDPLGAMAVYRMVLRPLSPAELIKVLNEETTYLNMAVVDRKLVAVVAD